MQASSVPKETTDSDSKEQKVNVSSAKDDRWTFWNQLLKVDCLAKTIKGHPINNGNVHIRPIKVNEKIRSEVSVKKAAFDDYADILIWMPMIQGIRLILPPMKTTDIFAIECIE